jgi:hypothetical protein
VKAGTTKGNLIISLRIRATHWTLSLWCLPRLVPVNEMLPLGPVVNRFCAPWAAERLSTEWQNCTFLSCSSYLTLFECKDSIPKCQFVSLNRIEVLEKPLNKIFMNKDSKEYEESMLRWIKKFRDQYAAKKAKEERFRSSLGARLRTPPSAPSAGSKGEGVD